MPKGHKRRTSLDNAALTESILKGYWHVTSDSLIMITWVLILGISFIKSFRKRREKQARYKILFFYSVKGVLTFLCIALFVVVFTHRLVLLTNALIDLPRMIRKDFVQATGVSVIPTEAAGGNLWIKDSKTGEVIELLVSDKSTRIGEHYEVLYLPHARVGAIVRKVDAA